MFRLVRSLRSFFTMTEHDVRSAMALTQVLVKDLAFRLSIESAIAALFLWIGEFQLTAIWLLMVIPSEFAEVILSRAMNKADVVTKRHLFAQFAISIFGGAAWAVTGAYLWWTGNIVYMSVGVLMMVGVTMHVSLKYAEWMKGAIIAAFSPVAALLFMACVPPNISHSLPERLLIVLGVFGLIYYMAIMAGANYSRQSKLKKALEAASQASEAKSIFLATMSHEIRTPMNGVLGMAELLERSRLDEAQKEMVHIIRASGDTLIGVIDDILDLSKIEAGHHALEPHVFSLNEMMSTIAATSEMSARDRNLTFLCNYDLDANLHLYGDALRLRQVIGNLISNAIKFTDEGLVSLSVEARPIENTEEIGLVIRVRDTGLGISEAEQARIFEPFVQGDGSMARRHGGTGLGLPIVQHFARLMGGSLTLDSTPGKGSEFTFTCTLPLAEAPEEAPSVILPLERPGISLARHDRPRVLVAEDHYPNRRVIELMLKNCDIDLSFAENGQQAVDACAGARFDMVLMDIQMPGLSGVEALHQIRSQERQLGQAPVPIVALTANAMKHQVAEYEQAGFSSHLSKPIMVEELMRTIQAYTPVDTMAFRDEQVQVRTVHYNS